MRAILKADVDDGRMTNATDTNTMLPDASRPYVLSRDEGDHVHFLDHRATRRSPPVIRAR
jgi:hypothetical protein